MRNLASISKGCRRSPGAMCGLLLSKTERSLDLLINQTWSTGGADHLLCYSHTFATRRTTQGRATRLIRWPVRLFGSLFFPEWAKALKLPDDMKALESLRSRVDDQLISLFRTGRTNWVGEKTYTKYVEPLRIDEASVGFCRLLLEKVESLQHEYDLWKWRRSPKLRIKKKK